MGESPRKMWMASYGQSSSQSVQPTHFLVMTSATLKWWLLFSVDISSASKGQAQTHHSQPTHDWRSTYALGRAAGFSISQRLPSSS